MNDHCGTLARETTRRMSERTRPAVECPCGYLDGNPRTLSHCVITVQQGKRLDRDKNNRSRANQVETEAIVVDDTAKLASEAAARLDPAERRLLAGCHCTRLHLCTAKSACANDCFLRSRIPPNRTSSATTSPDNSIFTPAPIQQCPGERSRTCCCLPGGRGRLAAHPRSFASPARSGKK